MTPKIKDGLSGDVTEAEAVVANVEVLSDVEKPVDEQAELTLLATDADEKLAAVVEEISKIEQAISDDLTLGDKDKNVMLENVERVKLRTEAWHRRFLKKIKETAHDLFSTASKKRRRSFMRDDGESEPASPESVQQDLATVSERLNYNKKKGLYYTGYDSYGNKKHQKNESKAREVWLSAWEHLVHAGKSVEKIKEENGLENQEQLEEKVVEAAHVFWNKVFSIRMLGESRSAVEKLITGKSPNGEAIPAEFFSTMSETLRKGFHKAFLEWLDRGMLRREYGKDHEIRKVNSRDVVAFMRSTNLENAYPEYLVKSFGFDDLKAVLGETQPAHNEEALLGHDKAKSSYNSLGGQGLEDEVANMAIHHAALQTAEVPTDGWHYEDQDLLASVREKTEAELPTFLNNLYESLKDQPTALIQAFKGLLKIPTYYYAPAGAYKTWAGYHAYSKEGEYVSSFTNTYGGFNSFEEWGKQMKGYAYSLSSPADFNTLLEFVLEKGKTNTHMNTLGVMFLDIIGRAVKYQKSESAKGIDGALVNEDVESLRRFTAIFPGEQSDGGSFFNTYLERLKGGVDILAQVDSEDIIVIQEKYPAVKTNIFDFASRCCNQSDFAEMIGNYIRQMRTFVEAVGFFHEHAFRVVTSDQNTVAQLLSVLAELPKDLNNSIKVRILDTCETWFKLSAEKRDAYLQVIYLIDKTPSQEIKRIANELITAIMDSDDPLENWKKIESIFIKNNLPLVGKIFKIFQVLHPSTRIEQTLAASSRLSPYLHQSSPKRREYTIFSDLLRVHIESGNRNLRQYLEMLKEGEKILAKLISIESGVKLTKNEQKRVQSFVAKLSTVFAESQIGVVTSQVTVPSDASVDQIKDIFSNLRSSLSVPEGQSVADRVVEMFASRLGYKNIDEVLLVMREKKQSAHERGLAYAQGAVNGQLALLDGDFLKGVDQQYIASILQNGSVAKEYLGASSDQDGTPYDTDIAAVGSMLEKSFSEVVSTSMASSYGNILFVIRDRGQFVRTSKETQGQIDPKKLELFDAGNEIHHGIRTGFPTTEIDFIVCKIATKIPESLALEIVQNGYYIPVVDQNGKIIFTPEQYDSLRGFYVGLERFDGEPFAYTETESTQPQFADVEKVKTHLDETKEQVDQMTQNLQEIIAEVLQEQGVHLKDSFDTSILGAELFDTGSTGRHTNLPNSFDFDLALKLDLADEGKFDKIVAALKERWHPDKDNSHGGNAQGDLHQLRFEGAHVGDLTVDIDIAFVSKSELAVYGSHDAVKEKLNWIQQHQGDDAWKDVVANIVVAKDILKKAEAYKKFEHGGMGGIGAENWILAHGGNFERAAQAFWQAAHNESGELRSLSAFQDHYQVIDPGVNVKFQGHDNFIKMLKEQGYQNMLKVIGEYFRWE